MRKSSIRVREIERVRKGGWICKFCDVINRDRNYCGNCGKQNHGVLSNVK